MYVTITRPIQENILLMLVILVHHFNLTWWHTRGLHKGWAPGLAWRAACRHRWRIPHRCSGPGISFILLGGLHWTEAAYLILTQQPWVRFWHFQEFFSWCCWDLLMALLRKEDRDLKISAEYWLVASLCHKKSRIIFYQTSSCLKMCS